MKKKIPYLEEWLELAQSGNFKKAQTIYYENLFPVVIDNFIDEHKGLISEGGTLFSILGFSPEPIILTARTVRPTKHVIFTSNQTSEGLEYLDKFLETPYEVVNIENETFITLYKALKEKLVLNPDSQLTLDITGGKKSMVASASIFGKDYGCRIVYVDFTDYIKDLRKPKPGSEVLNLVYDPFRDQPEIILE
ncbi:hypothetical protein [Ekhidna sp.]|uniref:hypothetical protein n=1 Tax=Ekhidna sp. TaxID=2608089 RepID=UPI0035192E6A